MKCKSKWFGNQKPGFTLVEMLTVLMIMTILIAISAPTMNTIVKKKKGYVYIPEAKAAYNALQIYLLEEFSVSNGVLNPMRISNNITAGIGSSGNILTARLEGSYTEGAVISGYRYHIEDGKLFAIMYDVKGYRISILNGEMVEVILIR